MPERKTLGDQSAAVPFNANTCLTPNAAALRKMDPTLPASCKRSSTTVSTAGSMGFCSGSSNKKPICEGDSKPLMEENKASGKRVITGAHFNQSLLCDSQRLSEKKACVTLCPRDKAALHK